jgi:hemerythrin
MHSLTADQAAHALDTVLRHTHTQLCRQINALAAQPATSFAAGWTDLVAGTETAFRDEERVMEEVRYAGLAEHRAENACILSALHHVSPRVDDGDHGIGREVLSALGAIISSHRCGVRIRPLAAEQLRGYQPPLCG